MVIFHCYVSSPEGNKPLNHQLSPHSCGGHLGDVKSPNLFSEKKSDRSIKSTGSLFWVFNLGRDEYPIATHVGVPGRPGRDFHAKRQRRHEELEELHVAQAKRQWRENSKPWLIGRWCAVFKTWWFSRVVLNGERIFWSVLFFHNTLQEGDVWWMCAKIAGWKWKAWLIVQDIGGRRVLYIGVCEFGYIGALFLRAAQAWPIDIHWHAGRSLWMLWSHSCPFTIGKLIEKGDPPIFYKLLQYITIYCIGGFSKPHRAIYFYHKGSVVWTTQVPSWSFRPSRCSRQSPWKPKSKVTWALNSETSRNGLNPGFHNKWFFWMCFLYVLVTTFIYSDNMNCHV